VQDCVGDEDIFALSAGAGASVRARAENPASTYPAHAAANDE